MAFECVAKKGRNPHELLGLHKSGEVIRLWRPGADTVTLLLKGKEVLLEKTQIKGLFHLELSKPIELTDYHIEHPNGLIGCDPYAFISTLTPKDEELFSKGEHDAIYRALGGRAVRHQGVLGVKFAVWAPSAHSVVLMGEFNGWSKELNPMRPMKNSGVWELFIPGLSFGEKYQFGIYTRDKRFLTKADPYAFQGDMRPNTTSIVCGIDAFKWKDALWLKKRREYHAYTKPLNVYEVHLGSWKRAEGGFKNYRELAQELVTYCKEVGYTHVELLPVMGHPLDESWGYQVSGFYALSRRYGEIEDFQYFVDTLHRHQIGVILDWVPGHFPTDSHALAHFDGTSLYEYKDPKQGYHPQWTTHIFNFGCPQVVNFLVGSALFYLREMHVDGIRVDAVSSMLYLDFERKEGEWTPNRYGGNENLEAIAFLRALSEKVKREFPDVLLIAEESHAFPGVTHPLDQGGLGFDLKWSLGWMNDTLRYFQRPYEDRGKYLTDLIHEMSYFFDDRFMLPLSHDEVVHGKKSLISKMPGNEFEKFANMRLLLSYMMCHPGKKLLFMGGEFGQWHEWACNEEVHWDLLQVPYHQKLHHFFRALCALYKKRSPLFEGDFDRGAFEWVHRDQKEAVLSYLRRGKGETLLFIHHFDRLQKERYFFPFQEAQRIDELFTTDLSEYGGYGMINREIHLDERGFYLTLPPLATLILDIT